VQFALTLWGFLTEVTPDLQADRRQAFSSVSHDYVAQRALVDAIPEETLRRKPADARGAAA
jgi:hypothetical protein